MPIYQGVISNDNTVYTEFKQTPTQHVEYHSSKNKFTTMSMNFKKKLRKCQKGLLLYLIL